MTKPYLVCIDSDGCVFDTMEIKHKECFCPAFIKHFSLQAVSKYAREAWEFTNLYSATRGIHRLLALRRAMDVLADRKEVLERNFSAPALTGLRAFLEGGSPLQLGELAAFGEAHPEYDDIPAVLAWSREVNERVGDMVHSVPPFPFVRTCLEALSEKADVVIVSATPEEALVREWKEHGLYDLLLAVKGQESGTKKEIIASLSPDYETGHVLMLGDAPGDRDAAFTCGALFYPICPDGEAESWEQFRNVIPAFLGGSYEGEMQDAFLSHFETLLPDEPHWERGKKA